jgi:deoxyribonuclease I
MLIYPFTILLVLFSHFSYALENLELKNSFYGKDIFSTNKSLDFKNNLQVILNSAHLQIPGDYDQISDLCPISKNSCTNPLSFSYRRVREFLFGQIYLEQSEGKYWVESFYCDGVVENSELPENGKLGPDSIPADAVLNTEHSWPQSLFTSNFPKGVQKTDLHILFPVRKKLNSLRGNRPYGYVVHETATTCKAAKFGLNEQGHSVFEPAAHSKGNVARALFYFSTRYGTKIDPVQEEVLREWHNLDPVDANELNRHEEIYDIQKIRNPYIDHPEWVNQVSDF